MWGYYFSRSSVITFLVIIVWLIANIFINIPPDFISKEGEVIHKTLLHKELCNPGKNHYHYFYDITYLTDNGKTVTVKNEEFKDFAKPYIKLIESNMYYTTNDWIITLFIILSIYGLIGFIITLIDNGFNDLNEFISGYENRLKAREMRINHFRILCNFIGYDNQQDYEDTMKAIEMYRNDENIQYAVRNHYRINVPTWTDMFKDIANIYRNILTQRNKEDETKEQQGCFCD